MEAKRYSIPLGQQELVIETGKLAKLASGSVLVRYGETVLLATAQASDKEATTDFLPLTVEFEERHYAIGKIPGSFMRREGKPGEKAILSARITDRQIRPLFPKGFRFETQVIITVMSADQENTPDVLGPIAASAALSISDIPWDGPCATVRVGRVDGQLIINPTLKQIDRSDLDLVVAATKDAVLMVEAGAEEVDEETIVAAIEFAHKEMQPVIALLEKMRSEVGKEKFEWKKGEETSDFEQFFAKCQEKGLRQALLTNGKKDRSIAVKALRDAVINELNPIDENAEQDAKKTEELKGLFDKVQQKELRRLILEEDLRADGRNTKTIRPITAEVGILPRTHGSSLFTRGETQVLGTVTLGTGRDEQIIDDLGIEEGDKFLLHYNFPPYSTGEVKRLGGQSRREVGHGALAKRALKSVLPDYNDFPYVIRVVGEVLESNGSSSMATVCAGTLAMMDAGVPIKKPVAGVAMGLIKEGENYKVLTDILGLEDALGDMDFKVCGTKDGINALQMDIKIKGITPQIMREALAQAREGRLHILEKMRTAIEEPKAMSQFAPRILSIKVPVDKIGAVIGPGGKNVRELEAMGASVDIGEDGTIRIYSSNAEAAEAVKSKIQNDVTGPEIGAIYEGTVMKTTDFGAFIRLFGNTDGMMHISQMAEGRIDKVEDVMKVGDKLTVKIANIDNRGKIDLVRPELEGKVKPRQPRR